MGRVQFKSVEDVPFVPVRAALRSGTIDDGGGTPDATIDTQEIRVLFEGSDDQPSLFEVRTTPDKPTESHAHRVDEIIYVLEGELIIGNRTYGPGSAMFIPANTLYAFNVGPSGVRYLNTRPRRDDSYVSKAQYMNERHAAGTAP